MKKTTALLLASLILMLFPFNKSIAQNTEIVIGPAHEVHTEFYTSKGIKIDETQYGHIKFSGNNIYLNVFDKSMKSIKEKKLNFQQSNKKLVYQYFLEINHEMYIFTSLLNSSGTKNSLFHQKLNKQSLRLEPAKKIVDFNHKEPIKKRIEYYIHHSPDQSKILISSENPDEEADKKSFQFVVLDNLFAELWRKDLTFPHPSKSFEINQQLIDDDGHVHLLAHRSILEGLWFRKNHEIISFWDSDKDYQSYPIDVNYLHLQEMKIGFDAAQNIIGGGFFTNKLQEHFSVLGCVLLQVNKKKQQLSFVKKQEFDPEFVLQHLKPGEEKSGRKKLAKGKKIGIQECFLRFTYVKENGGLILLGEIEKTVGDIKHYNDIIVIHTSTEGQITWTQKIPKNQITNSGTNRFHNFTPAFVNQQLYLLFNDYKGNTALENSKDRIAFRHRNIAEVVLVSIDSEGQTNRQVISPENEERMILQAHDCELVSQKEWFLYLEKKKENFLAKIEF